MIYRGFHNDIYENLMISESNYKNIKKNGRFYRQRKIPQKKTKNYPTKAKNDVQVEKYFNRFEMYNIINNYGN